MLLTTKTQRQNKKNLIQETESESKLPAKNTQRNVGYWKLVIWSIDSYSTVVTEMPIAYCGEMPNSIIT